MVVVDRSQCGSWSVSNNRTKDNGGAGIPSGTKEGTEENPSGTKEGTEETIVIVVVAEY